ncbi:MAG: hypothetical protein HQK70_11340 [Desulfamplus sp.]|nr:hypothetical protein [Desulfamplus sp.]
MESIIVIIIVSCAVIYCGIGLRKLITGKKQCSCSSNGGNCCSSARNSCGLSNTIDSNHIGSGSCGCEKL